MCFFTYNFESQSLYEVCQSVVACCVVVSSAKLDGINENTIRVLVNNGFENTSLQVRSLICDEMLCRVIHKSSLADVREDSKTHREALDKYLEGTKAPSSDGGPAPTSK